MRRLSAALVAALAPVAALAIVGAPALAHAGHGDGPGWTLDAGVTVPLGLAALVYAIGAARLWRRADRGRAGKRRDAALFAAGWISLAGALVSPLHEAGERSFTMHMIEHEIIMLVSALLFVAARPGAAMLWAFPAPLRRRLAGPARWRLWDVLADPFVATAVQGVVIVAWHAPVLFDLALRDEGWHIVQHLCFVGAALLFWRAMLFGKGGRAAALISALCLFATSMIGGALGALMALSGSPWYAPYAALGLTPAGLTPAQDQQLAGLIMWIPGGLYHLAASMWFLGRALRQGDLRIVSVVEGLEDGERDRREAADGDEKPDADLPSAAFP